MKTRIYILLVILLAATGMQARIFDQGERLYINMEAQSVKDAGGDLQYGWYATMNNYNYAYFFRGSTNAWSTQVKQYQGSVWYVEAPAGDWEYVILTRHSSANPSWDTRTHQTGNIWLYYYEGSEKKMREQNYIQNFYYNDGGDNNGANWEYVAPAPTGNPSSWQYEDEQICKEAAGTQYILQAKNYDYENTYCHSWFKYENNIWTRLDQSEWYTTEDRGHIALPVTLGGVNSDVYYFLQASRPSMCRLIRVRINQDCSEGAPGACKITSFVAVAADANVTDKTSAVNGVVAFDDKKNAGKLQIWCPDVDTLVIENADIETPQTFRLKGLDASSKKTYTLYAKFLEGSGCEASCQVTVEPPVKTPETHTSTGTEGDQNLTRFTEVDVKLTPNNQTSTYFMWTNSANQDTIIGTSSDNRNITFDAPSEATTITYYFLATNNPPTPEGNLITNGTFETKDNLESKYDYWGMGDAVNNYYDSHTGASGGYAIVKDSYTFYHSYNSVKAHEGEYFGLFDSKVTTNVEDQAAWIAKSGTNNPKLKVQAGVSYLFSFWVANVNAFYQMNNGARLQFQISYNGGSTWSNLGGEINLGNYKDNRWHGLSSIATPTTSSTNVALRVINKNTSNKNIGNDFALDDIRFEAITASSSNIAGYEIFPVKYIACAINSATFTQRQPIGCGTMVADVDFTVNFTNPRGDLYIYEGSTLLAHILHSEIGDNATSYTGVLKDQPVDNADHTLTVYFDDGTVKTDAPTTYVYNARAVPAISVKSVTWGEVACDAATATLTAVIAYTNQNGTLTANVDGGTSVSCSFTADSDDGKEVTLVIPGVAADGLANHKLNVNFSGTHGCSIADYTLPEAPVTPSALSKNFTFSTPGCTDLTTTLTFDLDYTYQQGDFTYWVDDITPKQTATYEAAQKGKKTLSNLTFTNIPADGKPTHKLHVEFSEANSCRKTYDLPAVPLSPVIDEVVVTNTIPAKVSCSTDSYEVKVKATTHYEATGKKIVFTYEDNGTKHDTAVVSGKAAEATLVLHNITEAGEPAATQTIYAAYEEYETCTKGSATPVTAPHHATIIGGFDVTVSELACGETKYTISGQVTFDMADGDLIVEYDGTHRQVISSPTSPASFTISGMEATGDNLTVKAWFSGSPDDACKAESKQFASPTVPHIAVETDYTYSAAACDDETTTLSFTLKYTYQQGTLHYYVDDLPEQTQSITEKDKNEQTLPLAFAGIPADGKTHQLHVRFDGANSCPVDVDLTVAPFSPVIRQVDATSVPATLTCENLTYPLELTITTPVDATGKQLEVSYTDGGAEQKVTVDATGKSTKVELTLQDMDATKVFTVSYTDRPECTKPSDAITLPSKPTCLEIDTTICVGDSYTENGFNVIEPAVGYYEETNGFNTLRLTVVDQPAIQVSAMSMVCDEQTDVQFPYTVESGSPDNFKVTINGQEYAATSDGSHITISRPAEMKAGNYTAAITSSQSGAPCETTVQVQFTIAMSNRMYSKWEDLLFIDNHDSLFVAYQWYRNDAVIAGATKQYLYDKENKMAGTADVYYCQATTADGKVIYTCAETFDDVTPSRTVEHAANSPQRVITLYDITGTELQRLVTTDPEATIVPSRPGIYVLYEVQGNKTRATKIIVHE